MSHGTSDSKRMSWEQSCDWITEQRTEWGSTMVYTPTFAWHREMKKSMKLKLLSGISQFWNTLNPDSIHIYALHTIAVLSPSWIQSLVAKWADSASVYPQLMVAVYDLGKTTTNWWGDCTQRLKWTPFWRRMSGGTCQWAEKNTDKQRVLFN